MKGRAFGMIMGLGAMVFLFGHVGEEKWSWAEEPQVKGVSEFAMLFNTKTAEQIRAWASEMLPLGSTGAIARFDQFEVKTFEMDGDHLVVVIGNRMLATTRMEIYVFAGEDRKPNEQGGWGLVLYRRTTAPEVLVELDETARQLIFCAKDGKLLLVLPAEDLGI